MMRARLAVECQAEVELSEKGATIANHPPFQATPCETHEFRTKTDTLESKGFSGALVRCISKA
jgi:hypothetical protein